MPMEAVQIVEPKDGGTFNLNKAALDKILFDPRVSSKKILPVAIVGKYRQGKSFLMNFFLRYLNHLKSKATGDWLDSDIPFHGFAFRSGSNAQTKGIWMWPEPFLMRDRNGEEVAILLLDCQGLHDTGTTEGDNGVIFALTALTASTMIYNTKENITQDRLHDLQFLGHYGEMIMQNSRDQDQINVSPPYQSLIFLVRDWQYPDEKEYGFKGGDELLEQKLELNIDCNLCHDIRNRLFSAPVRAYLMPHTGKMVSMGRFVNGNPNLKDIDEEFLDHVRIFVEDILSPRNLQPKIVNGEAVTCRELNLYFNAYFSAYKDGNIPEPKSFYEVSVAANNSISKNNALAYYKTEMDKLNFDDIESTGVALFYHHNEIQNAACGKFKFMGRNEVPQRCKSELLMEIKDIYNSKYVSIFQAAQKEKSHAEELKPKANEQANMKVTKIAHFKMNRWNGSKAQAKISEDGLSVNNGYEWNAIFAVHGFPITEHCRRKNFTGTIVYYFEAKGEERWKHHCYNILIVGLTSENIPTQVKNAYLTDSSIKSNPNCYAMSTEEGFCFIDGKRHEFEWPEEAVKPKTRKCEDVIGCGLLLNPENKLAVFFTRNGTLMGKKIPISPSMDDLDCLHPTVEIYDAWGEANFGGNPAKPFKFDIEKCPGLDLE